MAASDVAVSTSLEDEQVAKREEDIRRADGEQGLFKVRTVTCFIKLDEETSKWPAVFHRVQGLLTATLNKLARRPATKEQPQTAEATEEAEREREREGEGESAKGNYYEIQSVRVVTNPMSEWAQADSGLATVLERIGQLQALASQSSPLGVRLRVAIGHIEPQYASWIPAIIRRYSDVGNCCMNIAVDSLGVPESVHTLLAARVMQELATSTPRGEGNFNFTANFNCAPYIPYFPAAYHHGADSFALGFEYPALLVDELQQSLSEVAAKPATAKETESQSGSQSDIVADIQSGSEESGHAGEKRDEMLQRQAQRLRQRVMRHVTWIHQAVAGLGAEYGMEFVGFDTSPAPSKDTASITRVFELLGVEGGFGATGSVELAAWLTRLIKSLTTGPAMPVIGFSGLMLACLEDTGLAAAAQRGAYDLRALALYSAVCGIGLDTVPIPGDTPTAKIASLLADIGTMAFRLAKPLTVRLFPSVGLQAGQLTQFESSDLVNCTIFPVP